jgi:probable F420-dependent oxidoreductase
LTEPTGQKGLRPAMRYWLQLPQGGWVASRKNVRLYALLAEELGIDGVWLGDHIVIPAGYTSKYPYGDLHPVPPDRPFLEAYTTLSYIAGLAPRIRLAVTVAIAPYRHPLLHAKVAATLDTLSDGRLDIGLGSGWLREEFDALGLDYRKRHQATDETIEAMKRLWTGEPVSFSGDIISFGSVQCLPRPVQDPHPRLWIGGSGPKAFDRMVRFGAGWLGPDLPVTEFLALLGEFTARNATCGRTTPDVSAKLWIEPAAERQDDSLSLATSAPTNLDLLSKLESAGTTDIRIDLARLPSSERPAQIIALVKILRAEGILRVAR